MKGKFIVLNKRNGGCPVCQGEDGDCRQSDDDRNPLYLCRPSRGEIPGFNFIGETKDGVWGEYFIDNREQWLAENKNNWGNDRYYPGFGATKITSQALPKSEVKSNVVDFPKASNKESVNLSADERDKGYKEIISQLTLNKESRDDLLKRGLDDTSINNYGFASVGRGIKLTKANPLLPGIDGKKIISFGEGYIIPILNIDRLIVSFQQKILGSKYIWAKDSDTKEFDELPLQHAIKLNWKEGDELYLSEGVLKPWIASERLGLSFIGAVGGLFATSPHTFKNSLEILKPGKIIFTPDSGSLVNPLVLNNLRKIYYLLKEWGYQLYVADWGQGHRKKAKPDIDEMTIHELIEADNTLKLYQEWDVCCEIEAVRLNYQTEYDWRCNCSENGSIELNNNPLGILAKHGLSNLLDDSWKNKQIISSHYAWQDNKKYTPDVTFDERYCISVPAPKSGEATGICYHTGQGKSTKIIDLLLNELKDFGAIKIGYRNSLEFQFIYEMLEKINKNNLPSFLQFYHLNQDKANNLTRDDNGRVSLCADSLDKITDADFAGKIIILDEIESVLRHILFGGTLGDRQNIIIDKFEKALKTCDRLIIADGNLTDATCKYIEKVSGKKITKYYNKQLPERPPVKIYDAIGKDFKKIMGQISSESYPWIMSDTQIDSETSDLDMAEFGGTNLRIDGKTINDGENPDIKLFFESPDTVIDSGKYKRIITSPTVESGLSVTSQNISGVYLLAKHLEVNSLIQMIIRARDVKIPRHVCINDRVRDTDHNPLTAPSIRTLNKNFTAMMKESILSLGEEFGTDRDLIIETLLNQLEISLNSPTHALYETYLAIANYEKANLANCFKETLQKAGYPIEIISNELTEDTNYKKCKRSVKEAEASDITEAPLISPAQYESMEKRQDLKWQERCSVSKFRLLQQLPGIEENWEFGLVYHLLFENPKLISQAVNRFLAEHPELSKKRAEKSWYKIAKFNRQFIGTFNDSNKFIKEVGRLNLLELMKRLTTETYSNSTPELIELWSKWDYKQKCRSGIERGKYPTTLISRIAKKLGYEQNQTAKDKEKSYYLLTDLLSKDFGPIIKSCTETKLTMENSPENSPEIPWFDFWSAESSEPMSDIAFSGGENYSSIYIQNKNQPPLYDLPHIDHSESAHQKPISTKSDTEIGEDGQENLKEFIKDSLNDFLQDQRCDRLMGKKTKQGIDLLSDAISYCYNRADEIALELIETIARELALENELIGLVPADIAC